MCDTVFAISSQTFSICSLSKTTSSRPVYSTLLFCKAVLEMYGVTVWFGNITVQFKSKLAHLVLTALKIVGQEEYFNLHYLYANCILNQEQKIMGDQTHFLYSQYEMLPLVEDIESQCAN